jgi:hypothetical protein
VSPCDCPGQATLDELCTAGITDGLKKRTMKATRSRGITGSCGVAVDCRTVFRRVSRFGRVHCSILALFD